MMGWLTGTRRLTRMRGRLKRIQDDLHQLRATEDVLAEQVDHLDDLADDAHMRMVVSGTPLADRAWHQAQTDADRHRALLGEARNKMDRLLAKRDRLLEQLFALENGSRRRDDT